MQLLTDVILDPEAFADKFQSEENTAGTLMEMLVQSRWLEIRDPAYTKYTVADSMESFLVIARHAIPGDRGNKLSGGQSQRISIARAVLANTPIMIFDEATSSLDTESEKIVQDALDKLMLNRTSLVIAHRLSTVRDADKIIVLKKGKIVEEGSHDELIALNGYYKPLCEIQKVI